MRKIFLTLLLTLISTTFLNAVEYHFQEGFASSTPLGWIRQCGSTKSVNHTDLTFSNTYAAKFDATTSGIYNNNLISPQVTGADTLSFYVSKNSDLTYMNLYVGKIIGNDTTIIRTYNTIDFPKYTVNSGFLKISVPVKEKSANFKIIFYAIPSTNPNYTNVGWFVIDDIELTKYTTSTSNSSNSIDKIYTNFGDGITWGIPAKTSYETGGYPSSTINGFNLVKAFLYTGSMVCPAGETHKNRIVVDRSSQGGTFEFPVLKNVGEVEIHALTGTAGNSFRLDEWVNNQWQTIGTYITRKTPDSIYTIPLVRNTETKLCIANNTSSILNIYKVLTRTLQETIDLSLTSSSPSEGEVVFSNLKKTITLTFNKNIVKADGAIFLNGVSIPLDNCRILANVVTIPVTLTGTPSINKNYSLTVSAGAFAEEGNISNLSKNISVGFQTLKTVAYPSNYKALIDVMYKNVNSLNCRMDIYYPTDVTVSVPVVINMHGGGWNHGSKEEQSDFNMYFKQGYAVANVEYRMTGEATAPAAVEDVRGAMIYLLHHAQELNIDKNKIIFQGGSAGGHLALTAGYLQNNKMYDNDCEPYTGEIKILAVIDKYGPSYLNDFMFYTSLVNWLGSHASDQVFIQSISPASLVNANTPPTYIIHGDADPTVPYSQSVTLQAALQKAGVKNMFTTVPGGGHGGFTDTYNDQMEHEIITFLSEVINNSQAGIDSKVKRNEMDIELTGNRVIIHSTENTITRVFNLMGKEVFNTQNNNFQINQKGLFLVKVTSSRNESVIKFLIN